MITGNSTKPVENTNYTTTQHQWINLPPLKQDVIETPIISPSPHWVYPYPYSLHGPSVANSNKSQVIPSPSAGGMTTPTHPAQPVAKQWPQHQQMPSKHSSSHQGYYA